MFLEFVYEFGKNGFFGYGEEGDFTYWSLAHFLPILITIGLIYLIYRYREKLSQSKWDETLRFIMGGILIFCEAFYYWRIMYVGNGNNGEQLLTKLPLEVCEWSAYLCAFMLMKKSRHLFDICFYICLTLGAIPWFMPAVITNAGPAYARYYQFWLEHTIPVIAVFYMMFVHKFKPDFRKLWKPFAWLGCLATIAIIANYNIKDANFMYLAAGTDGDSIANMLPQSIPVRLCVYLGILLVLFALLSVPQIVKEIKARKQFKVEEISNTEETVTE